MLFVTRFQRVNCFSPAGKETVFSQRLIHGSYLEHNGGCAHFLYDLIDLNALCA